MAVIIDYISIPDCLLVQSITKVLTIYPWEKDSDFQVSVWQVKFLFIRCFRDISVQEVTYTSKIL